MVRYVSHYPHIAFLTVPCSTLHLVDFVTRYTRPAFGPARAFIWDDTALMNSDIAVWFETHVLSVTEVLGLVGCHVQSKPTGIGSAERNWRDYTTVKADGRASMGSDTAEKKSLIYGNAHMKHPEDDATGDMAPNPFLLWAAADERLFPDYEAKVVSAKAADRDFKNFIEEWEVTAIKENTASGEFKLKHKYKDVRFIDEEFNSSSFIISGENLEWSSGRSGGWKVIARHLDALGVPVDGGDEAYYINAALHAMIKESPQMGINVIHE
jgi:hypothetical protein